MRVGKACHRRTYGLSDWTWQRSRISQAGKEEGYLRLVVEYAEKVVEYLRLVVEYLRLDLAKNLLSNRLIATSRSGVMPSSSSRVPSSRISQAGSISGW